MSEANLDEVDRRGQLATSGLEKMLLGHKVAGAAYVSPAIIHRRLGSFASASYVGGGVVVGALALCTEPHAATSGPTSRPAPATASDRKITAAPVTRATLVDTAAVEHRSVYPEFQEIPVASSGLEVDDWFDGDAEVQRRQLPPAGEKEWVALGGRRRAPAIRSCRGWPGRQARSRATCWAAPR